MPLPIYVDRPAEMEIRDGVVHISFAEWGFSMPLRAFRIGLAKAQRMLNEHDTRGAILLFERRAGH